MGLRVHVEPAGHVPTFVRAAAMGVRLDSLLP